jgi:hypothetical protein
MNHEENFAKYRSALDKAMDNPPCMPFIGVFLQTVLALDTAKDVTGLKKRKQSCSTKISDVSNPNIRQRSGSSDLASNSVMNVEGSPRTQRRGSLLVRAKEKVFELIHDVKDHSFMPEKENGGSDSDQNNNPGGSRRNPDTESKRSSSGQRHRKLTLFECSDDDLSDDISKKPAFLQMKPKDMLFHYQIAALPYNYPNNPNVRDFLLHADYLPDDENYKISLLREPIKPKN